MHNNQEFKYTTSVVLVPVSLILLLWLVFWFEIRFGINFTTFGIYPQKVSGLKGVLFSPFIHSGIKHLYHNTIPLFVLTMGLFYFYRPIAWKILIYGILLSGILTWSIGRPSYHIGASGLIYVLVSFIFFKGIFAKHYRLIALSLLVVFFYGSMVWYMFPVKEGVSWEGHLAGFITGLIFAIAFKQAVAKPKKYSWEEPEYDDSKDPFMKHFDESGNFIESPKETEEQLPETDNQVKITYSFKPKSDD